MADVHSKVTRSYNMSRIKGKDTKPELLVRRFLFSLGLRFRLHDSKLPGKPDIVLKKFRTVVFIHGCFWHSHSCENLLPKSNEKYWTQKLSRNVERDHKNIDLLIKAGWKVLTVWECELQKANKLDTLQLLANRIVDSK